MDIINKIVDIFQSAPWKAIASAIVASGILSVVLQGVKKWFSLQSPKVINTLLFVFSSGVAGLHWLITESTANPTIIGEHTAAIAGLAGLLYQILVKPGYNIMQDAKALREQKSTVTVTNPGNQIVTQATVPMSSGTEVSIAPSVVASGTTVPPIAVNVAKPIPVSYLEDPKEPKAPAPVEASF